MVGYEGGIDILSLLDLSHIVIQSTYKSAWSVKASDGTTANDYSYAGRQVSINTATQQPLWLLANGAAGLTALDAGQQSRLVHIGGLRNGHR